MEEQLDVLSQMRRGSIPQPPPEQVAERFKATGC